MSNVVSLLLWVVVICGSTLCGVAIADESEVSATWKMALPGSTGFLGLFGDGLGRVPVCDTVGEWEMYDTDVANSTGCHLLPLGQQVILGKMTPVPPSPKYSAGRWPLMEVTVGATRYNGYVSMEDIHPEIPAGTMVYLSASNSSPRDLSEQRDSPPDKGLHLVQAATAIVLRHLPGGRDQNLLVEVKDGAFAGRKAWMRAADAETPRGSQADIYDETRSLMESGAPPDQ